MSDTRYYEEREIFSHENTIFSSQKNLKKIINFKDIYIFFL